VVLENVFGQHGARRNNTRRQEPHTFSSCTPTTGTMAEEEDIAALVIDNGSGMCKGVLSLFL